MTFLVQGSFLAQFLKECDQQVGGPAVTKKARKRFSSPLAVGLLAGANGLR